MLLISTNSVKSSRVWA